MAGTSIVGDTGACGSVRVTMTAYNAAKTLEATGSRLPGIVDERIPADDFSAAAPQPWPYGSGGTRPD